VHLKELRLTKPPKTYNVFLYIFVVKLALGLNTVLFSIVSSDQLLVRRSNDHRSLYKMEALLDDTPSPPKINSILPL
jgi:hypothetical protein